MKSYDQAPFHNGLLKKRTCTSTAWVAESKLSVLPAVISFIAEANQVIAYF